MLRLEQAEQLLRLRTEIFNLRGNKQVIQRVIENRAHGSEFLDGKLQAINMPVLLLWANRTYSRHCLGATRRIDRFPGAN